MTTREQVSEGRQLKASESMEEVDSALQAPDSIAVRRARNRLAARKSRQKRAEKNEELIEQVTRLEEKVKYWKGVALQQGPENAQDQRNTSVTVSAPEESLEEDLEEEEERLRRELEHLQRKNRVLDLRRKIAEARRSSEIPTDEPDPAGNSSPKPLGVHLSNGLRISDDDWAHKTTSPKRQAMTMSGGPEPYMGGSTAEYRLFTGACEHMFGRMPSDFRLDVNKITYATGFLCGDLQTAWGRKGVYQETTWDDFKDFLLSELNTASSNILWSYFHARQGKDQTVTQFVEYLERLEDQMEPFTVRQRSDRLLQSFWPEISDAIFNSPEQPRTRSEIIARAIDLEQNHKRQLEAAVRADAQNKHSDVDSHILNPAESPVVRNQNMRRNPR